MSTRKPHRLLMLAAGAVAVGFAIRALIRARRYLSLSDRTILITGGSRGLGLDLARFAADAHAKVAICARDPAELDRARDDIAQRGGRVLAIQCDVCDQQQVERMIRSVIGQFGSIDFLVNNAGIIQVGPMEEMGIADYEQTMQTHFLGPLYMTLAVMPHMRDRGRGRIVNVASIGGKMPAPHLLPYTASKFALVGFSEGLRAELAKDNIFVTTVAPGLFRSGSPRHAIFKGQNEKEYAWFSTADVLPVVSISPERLARKILKAAQYGQAELIAPFAASVQARLHGLLPGLTSEIAALVNRLLPAANGNDRRATGAQSTSPHTPRFAQHWNDEAGEKHNEMG